MAATAAAAAAAAATATATTAEDGGRRELRAMSQWLMISLAFALFFVFVLMPLTSTVRFAFDKGGGQFVKAITTEGALNALANSLLIATVVTLVNMGTGLVIAWVIVRYRFPGRSIFRTLIELPIAVPTAVVGISFLMLYSPTAFLGKMMDSWGIHVIASLSIIIFAHVFVTFPFMVRSLAIVMEKLDPAQEEAAHTLGATRRQTLWHVTLPALRGGLIAGIALTFTRSLGEFGSTFMLAGGQVWTGPLEIYRLSEVQINYQAASAVAILLMVLPFVILFGLNYLVDRMDRMEGS
jgi:sulfate transport system permease protein